LPSATVAAGSRVRPAPRRSIYEGGSWTLLAAVTDGIVMWAAALTAIQITGAPTRALTGALLALLAAAAMGRLAVRGMYGARPARMAVLDTIRHTVAALWMAGVIALALAGFLHAGGHAADALAWAWLLSTVGVVAMRTALALSRDQARRRGASGKRTLIVGAGVVGAQIERRLLARPALGLQPIGFVDSDPGPAFWSENAVSPVLGPLTSLRDVIESSGAEHVIVAFSAARDSDVQPIPRLCQDLGVEVSIVPRLFETVNDRQWVEHVGGLPLYGLHSVDPRSWQFAIKHTLDRVLAVALLVAVAPLFALIAAAVKLGSPGPVFFRQRRIGRDGQIFEMIKFRSMRTDGDTSPTLRPGSAPGGVEGADRRTRLGVVLRRTAIDELPQLVNVALGHMSLVGPRPERPEFVALFDTSVRRYDDRHRVKSGMTGWAQVHGLRGQTSLAERVEWDNWYIQNWSLWLDLKVLLMTPLEVLTSRSESRSPRPPRRPS
jgi:exopolysaccharide biosynthesis polyprenyl glycosylphosphotransferase